MTFNPALKKDLTELLSLAWPVVLSRVGMMAMGLVDIIVVGRYSASELGYLGLAWAPIAVALTTGIGLISGVQVMTARHIGEGRPEATGGVLRRGLIYAFWIGLAATAALIIAGPPLLMSIGLEPSLGRGAGEVLRVLAMGLVFHMMGTAAIFYLEALSRPKPATLAMWVCNLVNLALNLLLVPGALGFEAMGAVGSAWATAGSRAIFTIWLLIYIWRMKDARALGLFAAPIDGRAAAAEQRKVGYGGGISLGVETGGFAMLNLVAGWLGALAVAGWAVVLNVTGLIFMLPMGLGAATAVLVGRAYGAGDREATARAGFLGMGVCIVALSAVALSVFAFAWPIARAYTADPALVALTAPALQLGCLFFVTDGLQAVGAQALRARNDVWVSTGVQVVSYGVLIGPLAWLLSFPLGMGFFGILWAAIAASLVAGGLQGFRFWQLSRR